MTKSVYFMFDKYSYLVDITDYMLSGKLTVSIDSDNGLVPNTFQANNHICILISMYIDAYRYIIIQALMSKHHCMFLSHWWVFTYHWTQHTLYATIKIRFPYLNLGWHIGTPLYIKVGITKIWYSSDLNFIRDTQQLARLLWAVWKKCRLDTKSAL